MTNRPAGTRPEGPQRRGDQHEEASSPCGQFIEQPMRTGPGRRHRGGRRALVYWKEKATGDSKPVGAEKTEGEVARPVRPGGRAPPILAMLLLRWIPSLSQSSSQRRMATQTGTIPGTAAAAARFLVGRHFLARRWYRRGGGRPTAAAPEAQVSSVQFSSPVAASAWQNRQSAREAERQTLLRGAFFIFIFKKIKNLKIYAK